ncbi:MAG: group II intron reverse transcriptase/maturase [Rhodospirillales bacterium]|nr:group II intron reverse transcriptase/maturase [Rhodospirillales bacterium]
MPQAADRIREAAERNPKERLTALFHHITPDALRAAYFGLKKDAAAGVDGVTWATYGEGLDGHLLNLHSRLHRGGAYRAPPVRRVEIPKPDGGTRPLGIAALEDKIVQKAVVDVILTPIYEVEFLGFSYGFRPGRGVHDALDALAFGIGRRKVNWIADADLRAYFDTIPRDWLIRFLEHRIGDRRVIRLIRKWLNAGVMDDGSWTDTGMGTPQGNIVSPCLANVFLHYVLDLWFHGKWRPNVPEGEAIIVRYADDIVVGFQHKRDAERYLCDVRERLDRFGLSLHPDKTRLVEFGRYAHADRRKRGAGRPETFDFLGFTHFCTKTRNGRFRLGRKPVAKRVNRTLARIGEVLRRRRHHDIWEIGTWLGQVLQGWLNYFAVPGSGRWLQTFRRRLQRLWLRELRRRSQRHRFDWQRLARMTVILWPRARIRHPWPDQRFAVRHPR